MSALALNQKTREVRAASDAGLEERLALQRRIALVLERASRPRRRARRASAGATPCAGPSVALRAHDPERTLERGYALVEDPDGEPVTSAAAAAPPRRD